MIKLTFLEGNIADNTARRKLDMVVDTLQACRNTATDFAQAKAIAGNAKVILTVPCCQHELNRQMNKEKKNGRGKLWLSPNHE